ncbi:hypothetical protein [Peribacillus sp. Hz7]|uniref:hypothetical protein n=1 Tax=Peribacillus sp. Hz7 TaxID=3344873 RepID=UPI0035CB9B70
MAYNFLKVGVGLQVLFFILFFGAILPKINNVLGAIICLFVGLLSLFIGIRSFKQQKSILPIVVIIISVLILIFTIFAYFLGEAGYPPLILQ